MEIIETKGYGNVTRGDWGTRQEKGGSGPWGAGQGTAAAFHTESSCWNHWDDLVRHFGS